MPIFIGAARRVINPEIGDDICGQLHRRFCEYIRDDLEVNLLYLRRAEEQVLLACLDLAGIWADDDLPRLRAAMSAATGVPERSIILTCTHTHEGPDTGGLLTSDAPKNTAYLARLQEGLVYAAEEAVASARPARVGWGRGQAHVGFNRRLCWADGPHSMYGDSSRPDFTGLEGPDDPEHTVLWAVDENDRTLAVVHSNCAHATCMEGEQFASADFPGEARRLLREALGAVPVLYLQGASGDISPWDMLRVPYPHDGERRTREMGALLAGETLRLMLASAPVAEPELRHAYQDLTVGVRLPSAEALDRAREVAAAGPEGNAWQWVIATCGTLRLYERFHDHPFDTAPVHALRIGDYALLTNPCELYCQFGLDMKRRSPAAVTAVAQLADGFCGYCPTIYGQRGGGYSGDPIFWARLEAAAGYMIVDAAAQLVGGLWR
ncbi:MAG TPA: hypothetical protein VGM19_04860 [Armatimonadota bacterium]|jgi:hypothetical protein